MASCLITDIGLFGVLMSLRSVSLLHSFVLTLPSHQRYLELFGPYHSPCLHLHVPVENGYVVVVQISGKQSIPCCSWLFVWPQHYDPHIESVWSGDGDS